MFNNEIKDKKLYIEFLRVFACFFVIFNHTGETGFLLFCKYDSSTITYWIYCFISIFCKVSVPLFFAISGALLLNKEENIKTIYTKRIPKVCLTLFIVSIIYYLVNNGFDFSINGLYTFFVQVYMDSTSGHLWFMYSYIAFLASLPFLRSLVKNMKNEYFIYMFIIALFFKGFLPAIEYILKQSEIVMNSKIKIEWLTSTIVICPCMGYYLENRLNINKAKKHIIKLVVFDIFTILISCYLTYYKYKITGIYSQTFHNSFVIVNMITIYIISKSFICNAKNSKIFSTIVLSIGNCSYGIYLFHILCMKICYKQIWQTLLNIRINDMIASQLSCLAILIICFVFILILKKIPIIKKYI